MIAVIFAAVASLPQAPIQPISDTASTIVVGPIGARADSAMTRIAGLGFSGVVLAMKDGHIVLKKGYGMADRANGSPMTGNSVIQIGSNTKDFTIVAVLQLLERGRLTLDDSITRYFDGVPSDKRAITVRDLMLHRAGFDQHLGGDWEVVSRETEITKALASPLLFPPNTDRKYSNIGFSLLAAIIEKVSKKSYDEYVRDNILQPLGLHDTGLLLPHFDPKRVAHGYRDGADAGTFLQRPHAADGPYWNLRGNGGMLSTVSDMSTFYKALMGDGPLLKPATRDIVFHPDQPIMLAGSDLTFYFFYSRNPHAGVETILVANATEYPAMQARGILEAAMGIASPAGGGRAGAPGAQMSIDTVRAGSNQRPIAGSQRDAAGLDAPITIPDSPAGRALRAYLKAYLNADPATIRQFLQEQVIQNAEDHRTLDERVAGIKTMHDNLGFLTPVAVDSATDNSITVRMRASLGGVATFTLTVEDAAPHRITGLRVERD